MNPALWLACLLGFSLAAADAPVEPAGKSRPDTATLDREADQFFAGPIRRLEITTTRDAARKLRASPRESVPVTITTDGRRYDNVAMHLKGAAGSFRPLDDQPALTLNFSKLQPGQYLSGLDKIHLNNSVQDRSYLNEAIASELYRRAGVPTARSTHALVTLNGRDLGLYVLKEGYNTTFLRRNFPPGTNGPGNLYDGGFLQDVNQELELDAGKGPTDRSDLARLVRAADQPLVRRRERLEQVLDVRRFLAFLVGQALTDDWDGYARNRNNYRVYFSPPTGRAVFIPHGMDQLFREPGSPVEPGWSGMVAQQVMEIPEYQKQYREELLRITTNFFSPPVISNQVVQVTARIRTAMEGRPAEERKTLEWAMSAQRNQIFRRINSVWRQLGLSGSTTVPDLQLPSDPSLWEPRPRSGKAVLELVERVPGEALLQLGARARNTVASFRTRVSLDPGRYVFSGAARCSDVKGGKGAGLRISGSQRGAGLSGTRDWTSLRFEFTVPEEQDVELVVELEADGGDVWIDPRSLTVKRL